MYKRSIKKLIIMNNKVIKVLDVKHGKRVIKFFKQYCEVGGWAGNSVGSYYGIIDGCFYRWSLDDVRRNNAEIIELPEEKTYPRVMLVSNNNANWDNRRVVFMEKCGGFLAWKNAETLEEAKNETDVAYWRYAEEIEPIEVTLEEITEWKGVSKEQIKIKQ